MNDNNKLFSHLVYDKISDDIYYIGGSGRMMLRMNVLLAKKNDDGSRRHYYSEFLYDSKYNDYGQVVSIRRSYDYYMTLESLEDKSESIMIRVQDMILLQFKLTELSNWFRDQTAYIYKDNKLYLKDKYSVLIDGFPERKSIRLEPIVLNWEEKQDMGVRISLNNVFSDISLDKFYGLYYIINNFNMFQSAQMMLAYFGMPEYGTNRIKFDNRFTTNTFIEQKEPEPIIKKRDLNNNNNSRSYFDRI